MRVAILILLIAVSGFGQSKSINVKYDRFKDETTVLMEHDFARLMTRENVRMVSLGLAASYPGHAIKTAPEIVMAFSVIADSWEYSHSPSLIILVDGKKVLDDLRTKQVGSQAATNATAEIILASIPYPVLKQMSEGKQVEMQLGEIEFQLTTSQIAHIKEFLNALGGA